MARRKIKANPRTSLLLPLLLLLFPLLLIIGAFFLYLFLTPSTVEVSSVDRQFVADGVSSIPIIVNVQNIFGISIPGNSVGFSANTGVLGSSSCTTSLNGSCVVDFVPLKSLVNVDNEINVQAGSLSNFIIVSANADVAQSMSVTVVDSDIPANGYSSTVVTAQGYDKMDNTVPDGTRIIFNLQPSNLGNLSSEGICTTINGKCSVTLTSSINAGNGILTVFSGNSSSSKQMIFSKLPSKNLEVNISDSEIPANGKSNSLITIKAIDELQNPVSNEILVVSASIGTFENYSCITDDSGICSLLYTSSHTAGTDSLSLTIPSQDIQLSRSIINQPVSELDVSVSLRDNVGDPIVPAFARSTEYHGYEMATIIIGNLDSSVFEGMISLEVVGWSNKTFAPIVVPANGAISVSLSPPLSSDAYENLDSEPVAYQLVITDKQGQEVYKNSYRSTLAPVNTMVWGDSWDDLIAAWDTPNSPEVHELVVDAAAYTPWESITGYQEIPGYSHSDITYYHLKAVYDALKARNMKYVNAPFALDGAQTVYTPSQSLAVNGGNCIDGSMVFASALTSMGMNPLIVLTNDHAFVCVQEWYGSSYVQCVETTVVSTHRFEDAYARGREKFEQAQSRSDFKVIDVNGVIQDGVSPLPS